LLIGHDLPRRARVVGPRRDAVGRRRDDLDQPRLAVVALALGHLGADRVAGQRAGDEDDPAAVVAGDAGAAEGERVDLQLDRLAALRARRTGGGGGIGGGGRLRGGGGDVGGHPLRMAPPWTSTPTGLGRRRSRPTSTAPTTGASPATT